MSQQPPAQQQAQQPPAQDEQYDDEEYDSQDELQDEQQQADGSAMQTEEPAAPPQQQQQPQVAKAPNSGTDQNTRPVKRRRPDGRFESQQPAQSVQPAQQATPQSAESEALAPYKSGDKIDFNDFMDVKGQYDIYTAHIERSKVPYNRMTPEFKRTFNDLEAKMTEIKKIAMEFIDTVEQKKYLPPAIATDYRHAMSDHNTNALAQERVLGFVAAGRNYFESNVSEMRLENTSLKEKVRQLEESRQSAPPQQQRRAPSQPRAPKQAQQQSAPVPTFSNARPLAPQYNKWIDDVGGSTRAFDQSKLTPGQAAFSSCFNDMFNDGWQQASVMTIAPTTLPAGK
jgi:hypothetical protein